MRKLNTFSAVLVSGLALVAMTAPGAYASKGLVLKEYGVALADGAPASAGFFSEECVTRSAGTLTANASKEDKASFTTGVRQACFGTASISGFLTSVELTPGGKAKLAADVTVTLPGPCPYSVTKLKGSFDPSGGETFIKAEVKGKLVKGASKECEKSHTMFAYVNLGNEEAEPFETELT